MSKKPAYHQKCIRLLLAQTHLQLRSVFLGTIRHKMGKCAEDLRNIKSYEFNREINKIMISWRIMFISTKCSKTYKPLGDAFEARK